MEMRDLLEKMMKFAGEKVGQKPGDQWRGDDPNPPGKKLVGDSILKDLSKGKTPKTKEQELSEEYKAFLEAEFKDTVDKRPRRKSDRHPRGHEPKSGYKTVKADEGAMKEKDIELQDYRSMSHKEFQTAYGMTKTEWMNKNKALVIRNPDIKKSLGINENQYRWEVIDKDGNVKAVYNHNSPHYGDKTAASDIQYTLKSNPGSTIKATKDGQEFNWRSLVEGWESGPEEYQEPYDDADDAYERQRQEKIDTEAEKEWAKLPKVSTYKLLGRGPNMEPNYEFGGKEYDTLEAAIEARKQLMADPSTPHPEHIGIQTLTRVVDKEQTNEAVYTAPKNREDYDAKMAALQDLQNDPNTANDPELQKKIIIYMDNLQKVAHQHGWLSQPLESRGHKIIATKLKDIERAKRFASGELNIPTPQERQAQLKKLETSTEKKTVKELMVTPPQGTANQTMQQKTQAQDPKQAQAVAQAAQAMKSATGSSASATTLAKALDTASQGRPVQGQEATALQPLMKDMATVAQDPKLSGQFKSLVNQINQAQLKQK